MEILLPYICKWITIILVAVVIILLARHGLHIIRIRYGKVKVEFERSKEISEEPSPRIFPEKGEVENFISDLVKQDFLVFAGTGIVRETGVSPSWKRLLERFKSEEPTVISEDLEEVIEADYPKIAQKIYNILKESGREERYFEILKEGLRSTDANYSSHQRDIIETAKHIVTTNFDDSFECALNRELEGRNQTTRVIQSLPDLDYNALSKEYSVSYLHGRINERCVVFKEDDYKTFYPSQFDSNYGNDNLERFLRDIYEKCTIVFIGFSFADRYLLGALQKIHSDIQRNDAIGKDLKPLYKSRLEEIRHYVCLREFDKKREIQELMAREKFGNDRNVEIRMEAKEKWDGELSSTLESIKIKVLRYKEHKDWTQWFENIRELRRALQERGI